MSTQEINHQVTLRYEIKTGADDNLQTQVLNHVRLFKYIKNLKGKIYQAAVPPTCSCNLAVILQVMNVFSDVVWCREDICYPGLAKLFDTTLG